MKDISELLGCRYPIIQGAMGVICNPELVAAVSEAGGFGLLATGFMKDEEFLREQIQAVRKLTDKPFGANLAAINPMNMAFAQVMVEMDLPAVTTSAGQPGNLVALFKNEGIKVLHVVANVENAVKAEEAGVDAVIAEGSESGGLQGLAGVSTLVLTPLVADAVKIPVVAAGGIGDARGYRAAFALGAKGVQIGTRFIASKECIAHDQAKRALCQARETDTVLLGTDKFRVRVIRTPVVENLLKNPEDQSFARLVQHQDEAWLKGRLEVSPLAAGQVTGMIKSIKSVREITEEIVGEF